MGRLVEHQSGFDELSTGDAVWVGANPLAAIALFVSAIKNRATCVLGALASKLTSECFVGSIWKYRDADFDNWLAKSQKETEPCTISVLTPPVKGWTFIEAAQERLGVTTSDVKELGNLLIAGGHTLTCQQAQALAERTEAGEATGLVTNGCGNFFFVETGNEAEPVSVGYVHRYVVRDWNAGVDRLGYDYRWYVEDRFLVCNVEDTSKL